MAQRAECMMCRSEELSSDPQYPLEKLSVVAHAIAALGASLAVMAVSASVLGPASRNKMASDSKPLPHANTYLCAHTL